MFFFFVFLHFCLLVCLVRALVSTNMMLREVGLSVERRLVLCLVFFNCLFLCLFVALFVFVAAFVCLLLRFIPSVGTLWRG